MRSAVRELVELLNEELDDKGRRCPIVVFDSWVCAYRPVTSTDRDYAIHLSLPLRQLAVQALSEVQQES